MFKFLKEKIKGAVSKFTKNIEESKEEPEEKEEIIEELPKEEKIEEVKEETKEEEIREPEEKPKEEPKPEPKVEEKTAPKPEKKEEPVEKIPEKKGFFGRIKQAVATKKIDEKQFESMFWELEVALLENNVAVEVIEKIKVDLKEKLVDQPLKRGEVEKIIQSSLKDTISGLFQVEKIDFFSEVKKKKPFVICFVGINGSGKTTTIAKVAQLLKNNNMTCVLAAADTFRAAAIDQLQKHADNLNVKMIKHDYGSDAAAVAFDAVKYADQKEIDVVLIDTAGRMHSNTNLMDEMKKIIRVAKPDMKIFIGESITGNDCTEQAKKFNEAIGIDGIILSKADIDEKGGAAISVSKITGKPILFIGTGQEYNDLKPFEESIVLQSLDL